MRSFVPPLALLMACAAADTTDANGEPCREGTRVSQCAPDFTLVDADGATVSLSDHRGERVLLVAASMWCVRCQDLAGDLSAWFRDDADDDQVILNVLLQNRDSELPSVEDAATWRDTLDIPYPVLADDGSWRDVWDDGGGRHTYAAVGRDGVVSWRSKGYDEGTAEDLIAAVDDAP